MNYRPDLFLNVLANFGFGEIWQCPLQRWHEQVDACVEVGCLGRLVIDKDAEMQDHILPGQAPGFMELQISDMVLVDDHEYDTPLVPIVGIDCEQMTIDGILQSNHRPHSFAIGEEQWTHVSGRLAGAPEVH